MIFCILCCGPILEAYQFDFQQQHTLQVDPSASPHAEYGASQCEYQYLDVTWYLSTTTELSLSADPVTG